MTDGESRPWRLIAFVVGMLALIGGCSRPVSPSNDNPRVLQSHEQMLAAVQQVKDQTPHLPFVGDAELRMLRNDLSAMASEAPLDHRIWLLVEVGDLELAQGETELAIDHFQDALRLTKELTAGDPLSEEVLFRLAVACLRFGETENCVHCNNSESCLLPIRGAGVHEEQSGSRRSIVHLQELLKLNPHHLPGRWLLNLAYMTVGEYPSRVPPQFLISESVFSAQENFPQFVNAAPQIGLNTVSLSGGSIVDDFDGDGYLDIVTSAWNPSGELHYFRNTGDGTFSDRTVEAGFEGLFGGLNMVHADYDNDGDLDILVLRGAWLDEAGRHPNSLLRNDGTGRFRDVTFLAGLGDEHFPTQTAAWADYDNDGDLDLFVGNEGYSCQLFENRGNGTFCDVAEKAGVTNGEITKGCVWGDFNDDRYPDLYVSNLGGRNRLYRNDGRGKFTDVADEQGVAGPIESFPCWFWDYNNDGALDLFVAAYWIDMEMFVADYLGLPHQAEVDQMYRGNGRGGFDAVGKQLGIGRVTLTMGSNFGDLDNDGFPDFYLGTGYPEYEGLMPNRMYHNRAGQSFADITTSGGFGHLQKGHGVAFADIDNDGDQDVFIEMGGAYPGDASGNALFENPGFENHWIKVQLIGQQSNRSAIGARIRVDFTEAGEQRSVYQWVNSGGSFGCKPLRREIGVGRADQIDVLEVYWPTTDKKQQFRNVPVNQFIEITEGASNWRTRASSAFAFARKP